jgi:integrase
MGRLVKFIKPEEFSAILAAEKEKDYKLAYLFAYGSGLRLSEIIGYKRKTKQKFNKETNQLEYFLDETEIKPLTAEQIDLQSRIIRVVGGKGNKDRIVPLFPNFKESYLKLLPLKLKRSTLQAHFKKLCSKVLGINTSFHKLRHGFAVSSIKQGVKLPFLQMALGHSRLDTTGIYTQSDPQDMLEDYKKAWGEI